MVFFDAPSLNAWSPTLLSYTLVLCGYMPVSSVARAGQHTGSVAKLFWNVMPRSAMSFFVWGSACQNGVEVWSRSSTTRYTRFGRLWTIDSGVLVSPPQPLSAVRTRSRTAPASAREPRCIGGEPTGGSGPGLVAPDEGALAQARRDAEVQIGELDGQMGPVGGEERDPRRGLAPAPVDRGDVDRLADLVPRALGRSQRERAVHLP